ncbi:unnamed protein product [Orchesella dallaii]|uniref:HAT C-terminal dimerisation domain-containing protein n=1 Tax=Orchesella dallaii TaxID=48710 RepID=A0ABP1PI96_9HEXA
MSNKRSRRNCTFNDELAKEFPFLEKRHQLGDSEVYCKLCNNSFSIANSGRSQITSHLNTEGHKKCERAKASSKQISNFFANLKPEKEEFDLATREGTIAYHTVLHDHSFNSVTCTSKLLKTFYDKKISCAKTKCEKIVTKVLSVAAIDLVREEVANINYVNAAVDCSNHKSVKLMPVMIRYFTVNEGVKIRLIDIHSLKGETADIITTALLETLSKFKLDSKLVGICADNTNPNFGGINRKGKVNLFFKLKERLGREIVVIGCAAHIVHNSVETAADCLPFDIESILAKIYKYFSIYTVRIESLREFCDFVQIEFKPLLSSSKTRWLSLGKALERLLKLFVGVKSYFLSESTCPVVLKRFFQDECTELHLWFLHTQVHVFNQSILKIEKQNISAVETYSIVKNLIDSLSLRKVEKFTGLQAKLELRKLVENGEITGNKFYKTFDELFDVAIKYLTDWMQHFNCVSYFSWTSLTKLPSWKELEDSMATFTKFTGKTLSENELFDEYGFLGRYLTAEKIKEWEESPICADQKWALIFQHFKNSHVRHSNLLQIVELSLALPGTNAPVERVFSLVNNYWSAEKVNLSLETLNAVITMKVNMRMDCNDYFSYLKSNPELLKRIHSADKYL